MRGAAGTRSITFNHGVLGSSPSRLTNKTKDLWHLPPTVIEAGVTLGVTPAALVRRSTNWLWEAAIRKNASSATAGARGFYGRVIGPNLPPPLA